MTRQLDGLYQIQKKAVHRVAMMFADAFQHDPVWNAIFGDATLAQRGYAFETPVRYSMQYGKVYASSDALEGVAGWLPGAVADMTVWRILRSGALWPGMKIGAQITKNMRPIFKPIDEDRKAYISGKPYIYLQIIGVAPAFQGQGVGGKLLRALIEESEQTGISIYLETETEANVSIYEHFGFSVIKKIMLPIIYLPMWEMTRNV